METLFLCVYVLGISDQELGIMDQVNREVIDHMILKTVLGDTLPRHWCNACETCNSCEENFIS